MTRYEQITSMSKEQLAEFLFWFSLLQLPENFAERCKKKRFAKDIEKFLDKEIDFDEYDFREMIL